MDIWSKNDIYKVPKRAPDRARDKLAKLEQESDMAMDDNTVKISANLSGTVVNALKEMAGKKGVSITEALRQAISHEKYFLDAAERNERVLLENSKTGKLREVVLNPAMYKPDSDLV